MSKSLIIQHDNIIFDLFDNEIYFEYDTDKSVDSYITEEIMVELKEKDFNIIFIKDNLSNNYLELLGLRVAYHIRLSSELEDKRYVPIVILSDVDSYTLNNFEQTAQILFTKNLFLINNTKKQIEKIKSKKFSNLTKEEYRTSFLNRITVEAPKDYLSHHGIANEWSIYRWAKFLDADSDNIRANNKKIETMLYFKYLKELYRKADEQTDRKICTSDNKYKGNILLIDDEWNKGWSDILKKLFKGYDGINFQIFEYDFKDKSNFNLIVQVTHKELKKQIENADVIVLDLRLIEQDHNEENDIENYSGIKILKKIHEINAGIQVIMLTATGKSTILEKLYEKKILGYIKKEHPEDRSINTVENINKFIGLIGKGLNRKYLKKIWNLQEEMLKLEIFQNLKLSFNMEDDERRLLELKNSIPNIFSILNSDINKHFIFGMLSIYKCLEIICDYYIYEKWIQKNTKKAFWKHHNNKYINNDGNTSINNKLKSITNYLQVFKQNNDISKEDIDYITNSRNYVIHHIENQKMTDKQQIYTIKNPNEDNILTWYKLLKSIIIKM